MTRDCDYRLRLSSLFVLSVPTPNTLLLLFRFLFFSLPQDLDAYFLEGDATPILVQPVIKLAAAEDGFPAASAPAIGGSSSSLGSLDDTTWRQFIPNALASETIVKTGKVSKRKGFFSKNRQLILTDLPRLVYVDPVAMELKGTIPWPSGRPLRLEKLSATRFDVISHTLGKERAYHLTAPEGCDDWINAIQREIDCSK